jgi:hypothetical protein
MTTRRQSTPPAPYPLLAAGRLTLNMNRGAGDTSKLAGRGSELNEEKGLPSPTTQFRRRAWLAFQRALDPLAPPKPLPTKKLQR